MVCFRSAGFSLPCFRSWARETRALQQRAAEREFQLLEGGIEHPGILKAASYSATERGDCLVFPYDPEPERLDVFLTLAEEGFDICARIGLLRVIAEAVNMGEDAQGELLQILDAIDQAA